MSKARIVYQLECNECGASFIAQYDQDKQDYFLICPNNNLSKGKICNQANKKFKIPKPTLDLEPYEEN